MVKARWIGGFLGFITTGTVLGALAGYALGMIFESSMALESTRQDYNNREYDDYDAQRTRQQQYEAEGQRNAFLFSMLVLISYVIKADGKVMHSEMEALRQFLRQNFGEAARQQGEQIVLKLFEQQKQMGAARYQETIRSACVSMKRNMNYSQRLQLLNFLFMLAQADGRVDASEITAIRMIGQSLGVSAADVESLFNLQSGGDSLEAAYKVLGIAPTATDDEVKAAYRKMALKHHPDRVATLGEDVRKAAEKKFQEINDAKEKIFKARGM